MRIGGNAGGIAGDITDVVAGTNLTGGGASGAVTVNLNPALTGITSLGLTGAMLVTGVISPGAIGAADNPDFAPAGFSTCRVVRLTSGGAASTISGLAGGAAGRTVTLTNIAASIITILAESGLSVAGNRLSAATVLAAAGAAGSSVTLWYDTTSSRWRPLG